MQRSANRFHAWLQLLRAPNLLTVPGDPLVGIFLAAGPDSILPARAFLSLAAAFAFYLFGLIINDYCDIEEDRRTRPDRPLPAGTVKPRSALIWAVLLALAGLGACAAVNATVFMTGIALVAAICAYDLGFKKNPLLGPLTMGLCRALNLLLGAAALGRTAMLGNGVLIAAAGWLAYFAAVTAIAARETQRVDLGPKPWLPAVAVAMFAPAIIALRGKVPLAADRFLLLSGMLLTAILLLLLQTARKLGGVPDALIVSKMVGRLVLMVLPLQAALIMLSGRSAAPLIAAALILLLWPMSMVLSYRFYSS